MFMDRILVFCFRFSICKAGHTKILLGLWFLLPFIVMLCLIMGAFMASQGVSHICWPINEFNYNIILKKYDNDIIYNNNE